MITAISAYKSTKKYVAVNKSTNDIDKAWVAIETAICQGLFCTIYTTGSFDQGLKEYLEMNGYTVDCEISGGSIIQTIYTISWEDVKC